MSLRNIPAVDHLLQICNPLIIQFGRPLTLRAIRVVLDEIRAEIIAEDMVFDTGTFLRRMENKLTNCTISPLFSVINATGVILHTNLGRAPLSKSTRETMDNISTGYSNLEFDLETGKRGQRWVHSESIFQNLLGIKHNLVVNNCASAVLLVLTALANKKCVIIPRSQLIEIGGGFRVPDVMKQSGARLVEIGTTNKVRISDFENALLEVKSESPTFVMHAHQSNFKIVGFSDEPDLKSIIEISHRYNAFFIDDLGSGALIDTTKYGIQHEPTVQESLDAGADIVVFSGDKLIGGPQAGIILGNPELLKIIKKHPLARAVRADKTCLAGLNATLMHYLKDEFETKIPIWQMISMSQEKIKNRAEFWQTEIQLGNVIQSSSTIGGGSLPGETIPTWVLSILVKSPDKFLKKLRSAQPAVIARVHNSEILFDPRTVLIEQDASVISCIKECLAVKLN